MQHCREAHSWLQPSEERDDAGGDESQSDADCRHRPAVLGSCTQRVATALRQRAGLRGKQDRQRRPGRHHQHGRRQLNPPPIERQRSDNACCQSKPGTPAEREDRPSGPAAPSSRLQPAGRAGAPLSLRDREPGACQARRGARARSNIRPAPTGDIPQSDRKHRDAEETIGSTTRTGRPRKRQPTVRQRCLPYDLAGRRLHRPMQPMRRGAFAQLPAPPRWAGPRRTTQEPTDPARQEEWES